MDTLVYNQLSEIKNFNDILDPIGVAEFEEQYWEKNLLVISRDNPNFYNSLFQIDHVDKVLEVSRPRGGNLRVVKNQEPMLSSKFEQADGSLNLNQLYAAYADGHTIVINELDQFWQPLKTFCQNMTNFLSHHTAGNMYLTPKNQNALHPHYDTHDVYVLQIHGTKHWRLYDAVGARPLLNSHQPIFKAEQLRNPKEITLKAGDMMYMPRGIPHEAYTKDESSLHITIGTYPAQWLDLFQKSLFLLAHNTPELVKALPIGYLNHKNWTPEFTKEFKTTFNTILEKVASGAKAVESVGLLMEENRNKRSPKADGHFRALDRMNTINLDTKLIKRDGVISNVQMIGPFCRISFPGNVIKGPAAIAKALQFISNAKDHFILSDIPSINDKNKIKLAARLIRGGLLRFAD